MSFFGFDATLPRDRGHNQTAPGFGEAADPFAELGRRPQDEEEDDEDDGIDFEDTYDGLGDQLDETDDVFNDDTFGAEPAAQQSVGKDFDFSGQTAKIAGTIQEEQMLYAARQPPPKASPPKVIKKPAKTGYENYAQPGYIPQLEANASLWGISKKSSSDDPNHRRPQVHEQTAPSSKKIMSLSEVEAALLAQSKRQADSEPHGASAQIPSIPGYPADSRSMAAGIDMSAGRGAQILQRPHPQTNEQSHAELYQQSQVELPGHGIVPSQFAPSHRTVAPLQSNAHAAMTDHITPTQFGAPPRQILQNPNRLSGQGQILAQPLQHQRNISQPQILQISHGRNQSLPGPVFNIPQQLMQLSNEERNALLMDEAKRAKRNHKIFLLSRDNGLMTPQDKNFVTRIQLQQLVTATGGVDEQGPEAALTEDFYYQVYSQIRGAQRQTPQQPANQFAQTYLFQTGGRYGLAGRRNYRGSDNHVQRMEQQVQRAVEAAKLKPKNKQLVIEGSLGKISFSNAKTPKPLLNIKRQEGGEVKPVYPKSQQQKSAVMDRKAVLRDIENVYTTLMQMEDHERRLPAQITEHSDPTAIQKHMEWRQRIQALNEKLWRDLKVMEPIVPNSLTPHPFIAILSHPKGKKCIPRVFRHIDEQQRITILTMIMVHLDSLDVMQHGLPAPDEQQLSRSAREEIDLFMQAVMLPVFSYVNEAPLPIVIGLLGLVLDRTNVSHIVRTKIGVSILTLLISRAEVVKEATGAVDSDWQQWQRLYDRLFDVAEPALPLIFPGSVNDADDVHVWQFLAAMGAGASPEQQQRLVIGVKDRVMETVAMSKTLPPEMAAVRLGHVNLFMRAIGLDVELLG